MSIGVVDGFFGVRGKSRLNVQRPYANLLFLTNIGKMLSDGADHDHATAPENRFCGALRPTNNDRK